MQRKIGAALAVLLGFVVSFLIQHRASAQQTDGSGPMVAGSSVLECKADLAATKAELEQCYKKILPMSVGAPATSAAIVNKTPPPPPPKPMYNCVDSGKKVDDPSKCEPCPEGEVLVTGKFLTDRICVDKGLLDEINALKKRVDALEKKFADLGGLQKLKDDVQKLKEDLAKCVNREEFDALKKRVDNLEPSLWAFIETFCNHPLTDADKTPEGIKQYTKAHCSQGQKGFRFEAKVGAAVTFSPGEGMKFGPEVNVKFIFGAAQQKFVLNFGVGDALREERSGWIGYVTAAVGPRFCLNDTCSFALDALLGFRQHAHMGGANMRIGNQQFDNDVDAGTVGTVGLDFTHRPGDGMLILGVGGWGGYARRMNFIEYDNSRAFIRSRDGFTAGFNLFAGLSF